MSGRGFWLAAVIPLLAWIPFVRAEDKPPPPRDSVPKGVTVTRDLAYVPCGHEHQKLDLYLPEKKPDAPLPVIVWIHGGEWRVGDKAPCPADRFAAQGYAVASISYRLSQDAKFPAQIHDCKAAIRWLRAHAKAYNLDPDHIAAWGVSAGGHLSALLATTGDVKGLEGTEGGNLDESSRIQAAADWFGPIDLLHMGPGHDNADSPESELVGGPVQEHKKLATLASPLSHLTKEAAPFLISHGDKDDSVPIAQSELLAEGLKKAGVKVTFHTVKGGGHGDEAFFGNKENWELLTKFFEEHLKKAVPPGP
jgi:acetyl esterase/lipase